MIRAVWSGKCGLETVLLVMMQFIEKAGVLTYVVLANSAMLPLGNCFGLDGDRGASGDICCDFQQHDGANNTIQLGKASRHAHTLEKVAPWSAISGCFAVCISPLSEYLALDLIQRKEVLSQSNSIVEQECKGSDLNNLQVRRFGVPNRFHRPMQASLLVPDLHGPWHPLLLYIGHKSHRVG